MDVDHPLFFVRAAEFLVLGAIDTKCRLLQAPLVTTSSDHSSPIERGGGEDDGFEYRQ